MPAEINYKKKYLELRGKYIADLDMAFRLGVENGMQQAEKQQMQQQQADAQAAEQQQAELEARGMGGSNAPQEEPGQPSADPAAEQQGSELDQHINQLEGALGSASPEVQKSLQAIISLRKSQKEAAELKKSEQAIKGIVKALHKPAFKLGVQATANLDSNAKKAVTLQHKIVTDVMSAWQAEETKAGSEIEKILNIENLIKE